MAIKKGQFTDEKTGDVLYPQTSSDMVENLKENYISKAGDSLTGNLTFSNNKGIQGTKKAGTKLDILGVDSSDQVYVGDSSSTNSLALKSSTQPKWGDKILATTSDLLGDLTPKSVMTEKCGMINDICDMEVSIFKETSIVIDEGQVSKIYYKTLSAGKYEFKFQDIYKENTDDSMYFSLRLDDKYYQVLVREKSSLSIELNVPVSSIFIYKQAKPTGYGTVDSNGYMRIGTFEIIKSGEGSNRLFYAGEKFEIFEDAKVGLTGFINKNVPTWQSDYGAAVKSLALKEEIPNKASIVDMIYPVGSIYMSISSANPSTLFGGTWVSWGNGRVPVGVDSSDNDFKTVEKTGGAKNIQLNALIGNIEGNLNKLGYRTDISVPNNADYNAELHLGYGNTSGSHSSSHSTPVKNRNTGENPCTLQPYITCYMWKRTV